MAKRSKKSKKNKTHVSDTAEVYTGPVLIPRSIMQRDVVEANLEYSSVAVTSNSSGVISLVFGLDLALFHNYTNYSNSYDEFRCLAAEFWYIPEWQNALPLASSSSSVLGGALIFFIDRDSSAAPGSYDSFEFASCKLACCNQPKKLKFEMSAQPDAQWLNSTSQSPAWFKMYGNGFSNTVTYGTVFVKALYQFRGRA
jgi:hypothetical protein